MDIPRDDNPIHSTLIRILAQMDSLSARVEQQQTSLDLLNSLQTVRARGIAVDDVPAIHEDEPTDESSESDGEGEASESAAQHGIRAVELWKTDQPPNKDPFKPSFKLDNAADYSVWQFSMKKFLEKDGLLPFALGTARKPSVRDPSDAEAVRLFQRWSQFNTLCETAILSSVGKSQLSLLTRCSSPAEMWSRLKN